MVEGLEKSFGDLVVLRGLDLEVQPGRILGFLGRNGAGKTTTMRCIFGLLDQDAGSIRYGGQDLTRPIRRAFGYMPEERGLYPKMAIITQLAHFGRLAGMGGREARDAATGWLDQLGLADRSKDRLDTLSHGNQQRVQLAAALVHGPQVLVLDEPFSGLDPVGVAEMGAVLREAAARGATILFSSHQLELVEDLCVDVAIINGGVTVAHGDLARIRSQSQYRRVEVAVGGAPWVPDVMGAVPVGGDRPHVMVPASVTAEELLAAAGSVGTITTFRYEAPSLADLFHEAVKAEPAPLPRAPRARREHRSHRSTLSPGEGRRVSSGVGLIARREFVERGRSRVFLGVLIGSMLVILAGMFAVSLVGRPVPSASVTLAGQYSPTLAAEVQRVATSLGVDVVVLDSPSVELARQAVTGGSVDAALVDGDTIVSSGAPPASVDAVLRGAATAAARVQAAQELGLSQDAVDTLLEPVVIVVEDLSPSGPVDELAVARGAAAFFSVVILFILVMAFGQFVGSAVVEEKQTRVAELVLAKVSTASMLVGKVLGVGGLGLVQLVVLGVTYAVGLWAFGDGSAGLDLFRLGAGSLAWMTLWFIIGYAMYSFVFATMGATVSRLEDLQSLTYVPSVLLLPAYAVAAASLAGPASPLLAPMSLVPIWSPLLMPFRIVTGDAVWWEVGVALIGSAAFIALLVWFGARVYRGAALRTGGRVGLREAYRAG